MKPKLVVVEPRLPSSGEPIGHEEHKRGWLELEEEKRKYAAKSHVRRKDGFAPTYFQVRALDESFRIEEVVNGKAVILTGSFKNGENDDSNTVRGLVTDRVSLRMQLISNVFVILTRRRAREEEVK